MKLASLLLLALTTVSAHAATIAIIDTGLDYNHELIAPNLWENKKFFKSGPYRNAVYGWNFVDNNNEVIDYSHLGTFSPDVSKYIDLQAKSYLFSITEEEMAWAKEKGNDENFKYELNRFGSFIHGTHVAGIAVKGSKNKVMGIKLLPTPVKRTIEAASKTILKSGQPVFDPWKNLENLFVLISAQRTKEMLDISTFLKEHNVDVANGSYGTGIYQALPVVFRAFEMNFFRMPDTDELEKATKLFLKTLVSSGKLFVAMAPDTLFVFAAGNDGISNDVYGMSPANIKADNTISVAATYKDLFLAPFSNYGTKMVEVAAPGMIINSAIPGEGYISVSGTSQAAPFVANVAGRVKDANPKLSPKEIKQIIIGTVDKKLFLAGRVSSGGIVNAERAVMAAELSKKVTLIEAIQKARFQVKGEKSLKTFQFGDLMDVKPLPMPSEVTL